MKFREIYIGTKKECLDFLKDMFPKLIREELQIEDERVLISNNEDIEYKIKYEIDEEGNYGAIGLKISWGEKPEKEEEILIDYNK
jgi:hypothetical protein